MYYVYITMEQMQFFSISIPVIKQHEVYLKSLKYSLL